MLRKRIAALGAMSMLLGLLVPGTAEAATTYEIPFGQDFFESAGVPGFSARFYPESATIHKGDTLHFFGFGAPALFPADQVPSEEFEDRGAFVGDQFYLLADDSDDGPGDLKFNLAIDGTVLDCGTAENPCVWDGKAADPLLPHYTTPELYVTITANPGDVIYAMGGFGSNFRIEVVPDGEAASTQAELDARGAELMSRDWDIATSLHNKFSAKQTSHVNARGVRVWDVWAGVDQGPVSLLAMYPQKLSIGKGDKVQYHFNLEGEIHSVVTPKGPGIELLNSQFIPTCDPDGPGTSPDVEPIDFPEDGDPVCPDGSELEFDMPAETVQEQGNGVLSGPSDLEFSGIKFGDRLVGGSTPLNPWTLKYKAESPKKGWKFFCSIHGPFMGGFVKVN